MSYFPTTNNPIGASTSYISAAHTSTTGSNSFVRDIPLPAVKVAATAITELYHHIQTRGNNEETCHSLENDMQWLIFLANKHKVENIDNELSDLLEEFTRDVRELQAQLPKPNWMQSFIDSDYFKLRLNALAADLKTAIKKFEVFIQVRMVKDINSLRDDLVDLDLNDEQTFVIKGDLKQTIHSLNLVSERGIRIPTRGGTVRQSISASTWTSNGDIVIDTQAGF